MWGGQKVEWFNTWFGRCAWLEGVEQTLRSLSTKTYLHLLHCFNVEVCLRSIMNYPVCTLESVTIPLPVTSMNSWSGFLTKTCIWGFSLSGGPPDNTSSINDHKSPKHCIAVFLVSVFWRFVAPKETAPCFYTLHWALTLASKGYKLRAR